MGVVKDFRILKQIEEIAKEQPNKKYTFKDKTYLITEVIGEIKKETTLGSEFYQIFREYFRKL